MKSFCFWMSGLFIGLAVATAIARGSSVLGFSAVASCGWFAIAIMLGRSK